MSDTIDIDALLKRADEAIHVLRNGGDDDPYVVERPDSIIGDHDEGWTGIDVSDGQSFLSVAPIEGMPQISDAHVIAGSGKLIADLAAAIRAMKAAPVEIAEEMVERAELVIEKHLEALKEGGFIVPACDAHGLDYEMISDNGEHFCNECAADGFSGELVHLGLDTEAIAMARAAIAAALNGGKP